MQTMLEEEGVSGEVFNDSDRKEWFKTHGISDYADIIPKRSHAETSFGLLYMQANPQYEYGIFIDDDTLPMDGHDFFGEHMRNLSYKGKIDFVKSDKRWVNVLYQNFKRHGLYPRGYPYSMMHEKVIVESGIAKEVVCSQGLWTNIPDLDAVRILMDGNLTGQAETRTKETDFKGNFIVSPGNYLTVCSMNLAFKRQIIPVFYQLPMDDNQWKIGRFDDIWSGIFLKRACDVLNKQIISGYPLCEHNKAPRSTFKDLNAEVPALELNEHLWQILEQDDYTETDYEKLYLHFADILESAKINCINADFFPYMAKKMRRWIECLNRLKQ
ncbi:MAG: hypothetical protein QW590_02930 [Candidatus Bilamarchaeaceae archaeon]